MSYTIEIIIRSFFRLNALFFVFVAICFVSCGLDEYYVLDEPVTRNNYPTYNTSDELLKYFGFRTVKNASSGTFSYEGTAVYYRIYNNRSTLQSHISSIDSVNKSDNFDAAAKRVTDTYKYLPLAKSTGGRTDDVFLSSNDDGKSIEIRLHDYGEYKRGVKINGSSLGFYPMRNSNVSSGGKDKSFHFNPTSTNNIDIVPQKDDADVEYSTTATESGVWYINAYAFAVGKDANYTQTLSLVLHLGTIVINEKDFSK